MDYWRVEKDLKSNDWVFTTTYTSPITYDSHVDSYIWDWDKKDEHYRFNCKRCGAPNQIDVCEYCGCAYEEG